MRKTYIQFLSLLLCVAILCSLQHKLKTAQSGSTNWNPVMNKTEIMDISYEDIVKQRRHFLEVAMKQNRKTTEKYNDLEIARLENSLLNHRTFTDDLLNVMKEIIFYDKKSKRSSLYPKGFAIGQLETKNDIRYRHAQLYKNIPFVRTIISSRTNNVHLNKRTATSYNEKVIASKLNSNLVTKSIGNMVSKLTNYPAPKLDVHIVFKPNADFIRKSNTDQGSIQTTHKVPNYTIRGTTVIYTLLLSIIMLSVSLYVIAFFQQRSDFTAKLFTMYSILLAIKIVLTIWNDALQREVVLVALLNTYINIPIILLFFYSTMRRKQKELNPKEKLQLTLFYMSNSLFITLFVKQSNHIGIVIAVLLVITVYYIALLKRSNLHFSKQLRFRLYVAVVITFVVSIFVRVEMLEAFALVGISMFFLMEVIRTLSDMFTTLTEKERTIQQVTAQLEVLKQKRLQQNELLMQIKKRQIEKNHLRHELFRSITHELNTTLTFIHGYIRAMLDNIVEKSNPTYLRTMYEDAQTMQLLVSELNDFSLHEAGRMTYNRKDIQIASFLREFSKKRYPIYEEKEILMLYEEQIDTENEAQLICHIDPHRIKQVLLNLIKNAQKAIETKGTIMIKLTYKKATSYVTIAVSDTGVGIEKEHIPYIFERLYQINDTSYKEGMGLGLAICKEIVEAHGSPLHVNSIRGKGSTFSFMLPLKE